MNMYEGVWRLKKVFDKMKSMLQISHLHALISFKRAATIVLRDDNCHFLRVDKDDFNRILRVGSFNPFIYTVNVLEFQTLVGYIKRPRQTVQTQTRVLLKKQSDQGLLCLLF